MFSFPNDMPWRIKVDQKTLKTGLCVCFHRACEIQGDKLAQISSISSGSRCAALCSSKIKTLQCLNLTDGSLITIHDYSLL